MNTTKANRDSTLASDILDLLMIGVSGLGWFGLAAMAGASLSMACMCGAVGMCVGVLFVMANDR